MAIRAASDLFALLPPQDLTDPQKFMAAVAAVLANYHQAVIRDAAIAIARRSDRITIKIVTDICDELLAPISRQIERQAMQALPSPAGPSAERRDQQISDWSTRVKPVLQASFQRIEPERPPIKPSDGNYAARVMADIEARKARRVASEIEG